MNFELFNIEGTKLIATGQLATSYSQPLDFYCLGMGIKDDQSLEDTMIVVLVGA
jgi:hypothetical protein